MTDANERNGSSQGADVHDGVAAAEHDRAVVAAQIGRTPRAMAGVAARCVFGFPAVTQQSPTDDTGRPFPTAYYVTCPHLVRQIDRLEADAGVRRYEAAVAADPVLEAATMRAHARHSSIGEAAGAQPANIAASSDPKRLKCLHAHAAFALAQGDHPLGAEVLREAAPRWCDDARCASIVVD